MVDTPPFAGRLDHADERGFLDPDFRTAKLTKPKIFLVAVRRPVKDVCRAVPGRESFKLARPIFDIIPIDEPGPARIGHGPAEAAILAVVVCKNQSGYKLIIELPQCENEALRGVLFEDFVGLIDHRHGLGAKVDRGKKIRSSWRPASGERAKHRPDAGIGQDTIAVGAQRGIRFDHRPKGFAGGEIAKRVAKRRRAERLDSPGEIVQPRLRLL